MTDPERPPSADEARVDLTKPAESPAEPEAPFDPYRFGAPDVPPPPEYAPPGYVPPQGHVPPSSPPYAGGQYPGPYAGAPQGPYGGAPPGGAYGPPSGAGLPPYPGYPPQYPGGPGYPPPGGRPGNGRAVTALVLGILSVAMFWTSFLDAILVVLALIFGFIGLSESKWKHVGRGQALAGLICAAVGAVLAIGFTILIVHVNKQCNGYSSGSSAYEQCIRDHL